MPCLEATFESEYQRPALRDDFAPDSDFDPLVEFEPDRIPGC